MEEYQIIKHSIIKTVPIYDLFKNIATYENRNIYYVADERGHRITNYYCGIESLEIPDYYRVKYFFKTPTGIVPKYRVIRLRRNASGSILPGQEQIITDTYCHNITYGNAKTLLLDCDGMYTYLDINPLSPHYKKNLFPLIFNKATNFNSEYPNFAKVAIEDYEGYVFRPEYPLTSLITSDLLTLEEVQYLTGIIKDIELVAKNKLDYFTKKQDIAIVRKLVKSYDEEVK